MDSIDDPKNIVGLSGLLDDDDIESNIDLGDLEREISKGTLITKDEERDIADDFKNEMDRLSRNFNINTEPEETMSSNNSPNSTPPASPRGNSSFDYKSNNADFLYAENDPQINYMTREAHDQNKVSNIMKGIGDHDPEFNVEKEKDDDDKCSILEQIDMLRMTLEDDGIDIKSVPVANKSNSVRDIRDIYKSLRLKNDRNRYRSFAEELILAGAYGLEYIFDGKKEFFGRKIDLMGWPDTVKVKLRRMRFETSSLVQEIMQEHNMSSGSRLILELFPSMFLYSRNRKLTQDDNLVSDKQYKNAINQMNSF
jgi:hypothetical protein